MHPADCAHPHDSVSRAGQGHDEFDIDERVAPAYAASPEMCSMNMGSLDFSIQPLADRMGAYKDDWEEDYICGSENNIFRNTFGDIAKVARKLSTHDVKFEHECDDVGHLYNLKFCLDQGMFRAPSSIAPAARTPKPALASRQTSAAASPSVPAGNALAPPLPATLRAAMLPWILLAQAPTPDGDTLRLLRRGDEYSIRLTGGNELMSSRLSGSEEALAHLTLDALGARSAPHLLIGGLGMGFTLRAAQSGLSKRARITVAEIVPQLVDWARGAMAPVFGDCLDDPRVGIALDDVATLIRHAATPFDAILLDVDNGPDGLTRPGNDALYSDAGLAAARAALAPGGILSIWSAHPAPRFADRLSRAGFDTTTHEVRAGRTKRGAKHIIWIAKRIG